MFNMFDQGILGAFNWCVTPGRDGTLERCEDFGLGMSVWKVDTKTLLMWLMCWHVLTNGCDSWWLFPKHKGGLSCESTQGVRWTIVVWSTKVLLAGFRHCLFVICVKSNRWFFFPSWFMSQQRWHMFVDVCCIYFKNLNTNLRPWRVVWWTWALAVSATPCGTWWTSAPSAPPSSWIPRVHRPAAEHRPKRWRFWRSPRNRRIWRPKTWKLDKVGWFLKVFDGWSMLKLLGWKICGFIMLVKKNGLRIVEWWAFR